MSQKRRMQRAAMRGQTVTVRRVGGYEVTTSPMREAWANQASDEALRAVQRLNPMIREEPEAAVEELRVWIEREPHPVFYNYLAAALSLLGERRRSDEVAEANFRMHPRYLFARINYAHILLGRKDYPAVAEALGERMELSDLLDGRTRVHVSEYAGYYHLVALYRLSAGDRAEAERIFELMKAAAPHEEATFALERRLHPDRALRRLLR